MAWNEPGNNGANKDPWSGGNKNQGPPDLDKIIAQFFKGLRKFFSFQMPGRYNPPSNELGISASIIIAVLVLLWFLTGFYIVNPAEQAVVLRLGQFYEVQNPGLHWLARFVDTKYLVDVQKVYSFSLQGEFLTKSSEQDDLPNQVKAANLIGPDASDKSKNLVNVELNVQYRIRDPRAYLFNVENPDMTIQDVTAGALSDVIGKMKLDDALTTGREWLSSNVQEQLSQILARYNTGLELVAVTPRRLQAPDQVRAAFNDVNRADQDKATYIQQAQAYASKVVPLARGEAARILADATGYQQQVVLKAQAQIAKYQAIYNVYKSSPEVTRERMYMDAMQDIYTNTSKVLVDVNTNNMVYLPIDKMMATIRQKSAGSSASTEGQS